MLSYLQRVPLQRLDDWAVMGLRAAIILLGAWILTFALRLVFRRLNRFGAELIEQRGGAEQVELAKQTRTIASILRRALSSLIWGLACVLALREFNFDVGPLLAGAGVAGLAIGFAAQSVLKDWISGFFLLTEGNIRINDSIRVGELSGTVEQLTLRTTVLRAYDGTVHVFSNGTIQNFSNQTLGYAYAVFELAAEPGDDPERLQSALADAAAEVRADRQYAAFVLDALETSGIDRFTEQGAVFKARMKTLPNRQADVAREVHRRLIRLCTERGIGISTARRAILRMESGEARRAV